MATLIPEIAYSAWVRLTSGQKKRLKSCEVTVDGEYLFTFVCPQTDYIRVQTENTAQLGNAVGGETMEEILEKDTTIKIEN